MDMGIMVLYLHSNIHPLCSIAHKYTPVSELVSCSFFTIPFTYFFPAIRLALVSTFYHLFAHQLHLHHLNLHLEVLRVPLSSHWNGTHLLLQILVKRLNTMWWNLLKFVQDGCGHSMLQRNTFTLDHFIPSTLTSIELLHLLSSWVHSPTILL